MPACFQYFNYRLFGTCLNTSLLLCWNTLVTELLMVNFHRREGEILPPYIILHVPILNLDFFFTLLNRQYTDYWQYTKFLAILYEFCRTCFKGICKITWANWDCRQTLTVLSSLWRVSSLPLPLPCLSKEVRISWKEIIASTVLLVQL